MNIEKSKILDNLNSQKLIQGECSVASNLSNFVASFIGSWNRYGYCINYNAIEELEIEATYTSTSRAGLRPEVINRTDNLSVGIAYDNFDRFVDTKTGKDTLHDTVWIIYQNIDSTLENIEDVDDLREIYTKRHRRRFFEANDPELPFFPEISKISSGFRPEIFEKEDENIIVHHDVYNRIDTV
ncbi:hypothetical protein EVAR_25469_1 [Eumeta japonica]|uniref:Uncharacterized protein n=1 Tax=Eumeta variegata TaxID=151549 RepID=A0A4C1VKY2_EUMVA|nr:hypothetical protein EVAR_25469_1 [Eumeta japonica]